MLPHFSKIDLEAMQLVENQRLAQANYYLQLPQPGAHLSSGILLFLEMVFENDASLILSFRENGREIFASNAEFLIEKAAELHKNHGGPVVHAIDALVSPLWSAALSRELAGIRMTQTGDGNLANDALVLDFGTVAIAVFLEKEGGLQVARY